MKQSAANIRMLDSQAVPPPRPYQLHEVQIDGYIPGCRILAS